MSHSLGIAIESLVAVLLMVTIGYCMLLNTRLKRLKADEHSLKATIAELITATEIAERAIGGLEQALADVDFARTRVKLLPPRLQPFQDRALHLPAAVQDRDRRAVCVRAGARGRGRACGPQSIDGQGSRRGGPGVFRPQKV